jgi:dihydrodipicolinate synthase/N-acetylneuraminate lyase
MEKKIEEAIKEDLKHLGQATEFISATKEEQDRILENAKEGLSKRMVAAEKTTEELQKALTDRIREDKDFGYRLALLQKAVFEDLAEESGIDISDFAAYSKLAERFVMATKALAGYLAAEGIVSINPKE